MNRIASTLAPTRRRTTSGWARMYTVDTARFVVGNLPPGHSVASSTNGTATPASTSSAGYGSGTQAPSIRPARKSSSRP